MVGLLSFVDDLLLYQRAVCFHIQQIAKFGAVHQPNAHHPSFSIGIFVDPLWRVFERWLVTNAPKVPQEVLVRAAAEDVQVIYARTSRKWKTDINWQVNQLSLSEALSEDIR